MRILFLDFDGVWIIRKIVNNECAERIRMLILEKDLKIIISSNWRMDRDKDKAINMISQYIIRDRVLGAIEISNKNRSEQIASFLENISYSSMLILDDNIVEGYEGFSVITNPDEGFTCEDYKQAVEILNEQGE